jgi:MATE family multidrug resistance protein
MSYAIDGFAFAAESLVGRYVGAKDTKNLKKVIHLSFYWGIGLGFLFTISYALFSQPLLEIFTNKSKLVSISLDFMIWTIIAPVINSLCYIWDGIFIGATEGTAMRNSMLISLFLIYLPVYYLTVDHFFNHGLWFALTMFMIARSITLLYYYKRSTCFKIS